MHTIKNGSIVRLTCGCDAHVVMSLAPLVYVHYVARIERKGPRCHKEHHRRLARTVIRRDEVRSSRP